jgi:hypothetical protein
VNASLRSSALVVLSCSLALLGAGAGVAFAQAESVGPSPGRGPDALPGVRDVALVSPFEAGLAVAGTLGYGFTESVELLRDNHHRAFLQATGSYALVDWLAVGFGLSGHYDAHSGGNSDGDSSFVLGSRLHARARREVAPTWSLGGELALELPGADDLGRGLASVTPELRALTTWTGVAPKLVLGAQLGFRFDRSSYGVEDKARLSAADRIALGASDSGALLVGFAGTYAATPALNVLGELSWDVLVGADAPSVLRAPIRLVGGVRYALSRTLGLDLFIGVSPSGRPSVGELAPLAPIEPRLWLGAGLSALVIQHTRDVELVGRVVDERGAPLPGARIVATDAIKKITRTATADGSGRFALTALEGTRFALRAQALHHKAAQRDAQLTAARTDLGDIVLPRGHGAIRGRVLGPEHLPRASVVVSAFESVAHSASDEPAIAEAVTRDDGSFELPVLPAGAIHLSASALGFRDAQSDALVQVEGETVVELKLSEALPEGQIRGTVRGAKGVLLTATIRVEPLGLAVNATTDGAFSIDVAPGRYELLVTATGYEPQQRVVDVERDGVTVLLVDLVRQP